MSERWWRGGIVYEIYPRSFRDANGDGIGDLAGVAENLGHVASLGADAIWITPFYKSPMADFGYDVADYCAVDPSFGSMADFDRVVAEARWLGLKVLVDYVASHTSDQHPWFAESRASREGDKADWYVWADRKADGTPPNNWLSVFGGPAWEWDTKRRQYYLHHFLASQPALNMQNEAVQQATLDAMTFWLERGVDGFRLDALNFAMCDPALADNPPAAHPERSEQPLSNPYAYQQHLHDKSRPEMPAFLQKVRRLLDRYGATASLAEIGDDLDRTPALMAEYSSGGDKLHMCYGFDFLGPNFTPRFIAETVARFETLAGGAWPCWAFSNHDCMRHVSRWTRPGDDPAAVARLAIAVLLSLRGSICLYQGEELGLPEAELTFDQLKDPAGIRFWPDYKGRDGCRTPMPWDDAQPNAGFGTGAPWLPVAPAHLPLCVARQEDDAGSTLNFYRSAIRARKTSPALREGSIVCREAGADVLVIERASGDETVVCAFNFSGERRRAPEGVEGAVILTSGRNGASEIGPLGFIWSRQETGHP